MHIYHRLVCILAISVLILPGAVQALNPEKLLGRILLQIESKGEAWYLDPQTGKRIFLGRPSDAFQIMRTLGKGITNKDLARIAYSDEKRTWDTKFARTFSGTIFLQVQAKGEAWYINPTDLKRYYLGTPTAAFSVMRQLGLGISNNDIATIPLSTAETIKEEQKQKTTKETSTALEKKQTSEKADLSAYAGSYRCWSYNVSGGGGGDCRLFAPIVLNKDGTYSVSSEKGTFTVAGDSITLSESKLRGIGKLIGGTQIRFEYDYNAWHHVITYLKEGGTTSPSADGTASEVPVQVILQYPAKDSALNGIVTVELVPEGQDVKTATYKPTAIAVWDGDKRVTASFHKATNTPQTKKKYTVYTNTGSAATAVGSLDLTNVKEELTVTINVTTGETKQSAVDRPEGPEIVVEIDLVYPSQDSSLGSIQFIVLVPEGEDPAVAVYKPMALAVWDGGKTVVGSFHKATNQVKTKAKYTVYADWGREMIKSGTLDLTTITSGPLKKTFQTTISGSSPSSQAPATPSSPLPSSPAVTYISVSLTLQYAAGDASLDNVTRIGLVKQGETYDPGYGNLAGYGAAQQLVASFSTIEAGFLYDVYTSSYSTGAKKVGTLDLRGTSQNTTKTISVL